MDAVAVVANASGIELVRSDSDYAEEIAELSEGAVQFVACKKSMQAVGLTRDDILDVVETAPRPSENLPANGVDMHRHSQSPLQQQIER
nr:DsrE family protein [Halovenus rubra]